MDTAIRARLEEVQSRMVRHSKAITEACDGREFPGCLFVRPERIPHHVKMLAMLSYGLQLLNA